MHGREQKIILIVTHTTAMQDAGQPIGSYLRFRVLFKDTSAYGLGGVGDRTANLTINRQLTATLAETSRLL